MSTEEPDPERRLRVAQIIAKMQEACAEKSLGDVQAALGNFVASVAFALPDPEDFVLVTMEVISEIFRGIREARAAGKDPTTIVN